MYIATIWRSEKNMIFATVKSVLVLCIMYVFIPLLSGKIPLNIFFFRFVCSEKSKFILIDVLKNWFVSLSLSRSVRYLVASSKLSWNNLCDNYGFNVFNHCRCFIDTDRWDSSWIQDYRSRYTEFNDTSNIDLDYCSIDGFHLWKSTSASSLIAELQPTNTSESIPSLNSVYTSQTSNNNQSNFDQPLTWSPVTITLECNLTLILSPRFPREFSTSDSSLSNFFSSLRLLESHCPNHHHTTAIPDPYLHSSTYLTNKSPRKESSFNSRSFKRLFLLIKYRLNALLAYLTLFIIVIIFGTIIFMDILKYGYNTGLARKKRQRFERKQFARHSRRIFKPSVIHRPSCLNIPDLQTIPEEENESIV